MLDYSKVRFLWRGDAGRKVSSGRYDKIYDMGPRAATGDATFATAATRPIVDELSDWYGLNVGQIQNAIRNNTMVGAVLGVIGSGGALPTNWGGGAAGLTREIVGIGSENGVDYIDIKHSGTANTTFTQIQFEGSTVAAALSGQTWTISAWYKMVSSVLPPTAVQIQFDERTAGGSVAAQGATTQTVTSTLTRFSATRTLTAGTTAFIQPVTNMSLVNGASYDFTIRIGLPQMEQSAYAEPVVRTSGTAVASVGTIAPIPDAIPVTGTIIVWDNMVNAYNLIGNRIFDSEDLSTTYLRLFKDITNTEQLRITVHNNTSVYSANLLWQPTNQRKRWFFAMTFNGTDVEVYRGDVQGNIEKVIDTTYTPGTAAIRDLYLHTTAAGEGQVGASFLDIMTYDEVMTEDEITEIFYGSIPVFQQTAYAGTFVDKFRQKVQAETGSTYDTTLEAEVLADWSTEL